MAAVVRTVYFTDTGDELVVTAACKVCKLTQADLASTPFDLVVSPRGMAHLTDEYGDTDCGKDATRVGWWWPG